MSSKLFYIFKKTTVKISFISLLLSGNNQEFRSSWVITWDHIDKNKNQIQNVNTIQTIMNNHLKANMNAVIFQIRQGGTAYYESEYEPWGHYAGYNHPGYDPLEIAIEEAHKKGLELHAWFNVFQTSSTTEGSPAKEHPEWICRDQNGSPMTSYRSLSPGLKEVRDYTVKVAMEIVNKYDIDGLHLDYIRWNEHSNSLRGQNTVENELQRLDGFISSEELDQINNLSGRYLYDYLHPYSAGTPEGYSSWEEWWRWSVTEFVRTLHDSIQDVKPHVKLSAAVLGKYNWSGWQGYGSVFQDAALWYNEGYVDHLMPMHYHWTSNDQFIGMLENNCPECWRLFISPGINSNRVFTVGPGSYILDENGLWNNHGPIINSIRSLDWVDGFQFFSYGTWRDKNYFIEAGNSFFKNKTKINKWSSSGNKPPAPTLTINNIGPFTNQLTTYQKEPNGDPSWIILYRTSSNPDPSSSEIINVQFSNNVSIFIDSLTTADTSKSLIYFSTTANRTWNESDISNYVFSNGEFIPDSYSLGQNYPNPFNEKTSIEYSISNYNFIKIQIFNLLGVKIKTLVDKVQIPGNYKTYWDGKNYLGKEQPSGIYFYILITEGKIKNKRKMIFLK